MCTSHCWCLFQHRNNFFAAYYTPLNLSSSDIAGRAGRLGVTDRSDCPNVSHSALGGRQCDRWRTAVMCDRTVSPSCGGCLHARRCRRSGRPTGHLAVAARRNSPHSKIGHRDVSGATGRTVGTPSPTTQWRFVSLVMRAARHCSRYGSVAVACRHGREPSGAITKQAVNAVV
jgi:hypothetical protein